MKSHERVVRAIRFEHPDCVPVWNINKDELEGDVLRYDMRLYRDMSDDSESRKDKLSEWGYVWHNLDDGTMGHPTSSVINCDKDFERYRVPDVNPKLRFAALDEYLAVSKDHYRLAMYVINGFTTYTFLRGFENALVDLYERNPKALKLLEDIFAFETVLMRSCSEAGFHGFHIGDDWGTQQGMMISPNMWNGIFAPLYRGLIDEAHRLGMHIWFHSCGNFAPIINKMHEIGVDVINIAQPNVVDIKAVGRALKGKQCFLMPISYQTTSISGTREEIYANAEVMFRTLGTVEGGFIGYVEEYECMGMTEDNYRACREAFAQLNQQQI